MHACTVQVEAAKVQPLATELAALHASLAERNGVMDEAAVRIQTSVREAEDAAKRESRAREEVSRLVVQVATLQHKLDEVHAASEAAQRSLATKTEDAVSLEATCKEVWSIFQPDGFIELLDTFDMIL